MTPESEDLGVTPMSLDMARRISRTSCLLDCRQRRANMPSYQIIYLDSDGRRVGSVHAECANDKHAMVLAHAMKFRQSLHLEVWERDTLIYCRPEKLSQVARRLQDLIPAA